MKRSYYDNTIEGFLDDSNTSILGSLSLNHSNRTLTDLQKNAWVGQIQILKDQLVNKRGSIYFEFAIPRMGKRVDNIVIIDDIVFVIEFKVGDNRYDKYAIEQVIDYTVDLKNFHEGSHNVQLIPILVSTNAAESFSSLDDVINHSTSATANKENLGQSLDAFTNPHNQKINIEAWEDSIYKPTPTIVEAAQALYRGHNVKEITRSDSGAINLSVTADCISEIIENSKENNQKSICFVTGVPGAGKTLAGLNIANERMNVDQDEHAVFLSGNGPLVDVLREALTRDEVRSAKENGVRVIKKEAAIKANAFIQNIHHFRDEYLRDSSAPIEKVVVFDEAQRAWTKEHTHKFMKRNKGIVDFEMSEPNFLVSVMDRHQDWSTIICLIGGGQEINTGEAGLEEWINALQNHFSDWRIYLSNKIIENQNYLKTDYIRDWVTNNGLIREELHLSTSVRSFRSENLSQFVEEMLDLNKSKSIELFHQIKNDYPIVVTRNLDNAKRWLKGRAKGSERIGLISSSGARRLRSMGVDVKNEISAPNWFLNDRNDVRSSYFLECVATEFDIQGLEIDWACVAWGGNFHILGVDWKYQNFKGTKWQNINQETEKEYLKNTYRVLLTRARQGLVIYIPEGDNSDHTRPSEYYDHTFEYLLELGISEV